MQGLSERALSFVVRKNKIKREFSILDLHKLLDLLLAVYLPVLCAFFFVFL